MSSSYTPTGTLKHLGLQDYVSVEAVIKTIKRFDMVENDDQLAMFIDHLATEKEISAEGQVVMPFSKYKGRTVDEVVTIDRGFFVWLMKNNTTMGPNDKYDGELYFAIIHALERTA